jgi:ubiquinone/menaquinone biosynthesis C-methylase UbiE
MLMNTDEEWEKWGKTDPYYGVKTMPQFRSWNLNEEAKKEFFDMGRKEIDEVFEICRNHFDPDFSPEKVLDFGCGVGRLVIPLAKKASHVVGLDVSDSMLEEARKNCQKYNVNNVSLLKSDDHLSSLKGTFDFIHSFIVFQHLPADKGTKLFTKLLNFLNEDGICAVQFTYSLPIYKENNGIPSPISEYKKQKRRLKQFIRDTCRHALKSAKNFFSSEKKKASRKDPEMQMNDYNMNELLFIIQSAGVENIHIKFTDHGGFLGAYIFFRKPGKS